MTTQPIEQTFRPARPPRQPRTAARHLTPVPTPVASTTETDGTDAAAPGFDVEKWGCVGYIEAGLPIVTKAVAVKSGLLTITALSTLLGRQPETIKRAIAEGTAPGPVAIQQAITGGGNHRLMFSAAQYEEQALNRRRRSRPPVRVGLRTSGATGPYRWRDPARWAADPAPTPSRPGARP